MHASSHASVLPLTAVRFLARGGGNVDQGLTRNAILPHTHARSLSARFLLRLYSSPHALMLPLTPHVETRILPHTPSCFPLVCSHARILPLTPVRLFSSTWTASPYSCIMHARRLTCADSSVRVNFFESTFRRVHCPDSSVRVIGSQPSLGTPSCRVTLLSHLSECPNR